MLKPTNDRVLILPDPRETQTASGLILPDTAKVERPVTGTVVIGNDSVKKGDRVLFSLFALDEVDVDGVPHCLVSANGILGVFV